MLLMFISTKVYLENPPLLLLISKPDFEEVYTEKKKLSEILYHTSSTDT